MFGYEEEEVRGTTLYDLVPHDPGGVDWNVERALEKGHLLVGERVYRRKDGSRIDVEVSGGVITYGGKEVICSVVRDITERKRAEEALRRSERSLAAAQRLAHVGNWEYSIREDEALWSDELYRIFGLDPQRFVPTYKEFLERTHPKDRDLLRRAVRKALLGVEPTGVVGYRIVRPGGEVRHVESQYELGRDAAGRPEVLNGTVQDVTERKRAEAALRASEARFRTLVEQSPFSIQILSPDGRTLRVNRAWEELFGATLDEIEGYNILEDPQLVEKGVMPYILKGFTGEPAKTPPIAYVPDETIPGASDHGGQERWAQGFIYPIKDEAGNVQEVVLMHEDVSKRKRAEEALAGVREAERNRMARDLHDGALQDLTYALAEAQIVRMLSEDPNLDERLDRQIGALKRSAQELREAVYGLLPTGAEDRPLPERLGLLVEASSRISPGCDISLLIGKDSPSDPSGEDATEVLRIVQEALSNARKHSGADNVRVSLKTDGDDLVVEVSDDGRGFQPGTMSAGVGLRSMRERATALGGGLEIWSGPGKGTRVTFRIPLGNIGGGRE